ncbi:MAG: heavy metal translocating P-type ATPase metal-binding domain-containing protein [Nitrospirota bacterium]
MERPEHTPTCAHCLGEAAGAGAVREGDKTFCCTGCRGVYQLLCGQGLASFYGLREGWRPGRPVFEAASPALFEDQVLSAGGERQLDLSLSGLRCAACVWLIERVLGRQAGVTSARVNYATHRARVRWDPERTDLGAVLERISSLGYSPRPAFSSGFAEAIARERKSLLIRLGTAGFFSLQVMLFSLALYIGYFDGMDPWAKRLIQAVMWALATPVLFYSGYPFIVHTLRGIRNRAATMDTLVFLGSMSAYAFSAVQVLRGGEVYFDTAVMIVTLILFGRLLEAGARGKGQEALGALLSLQPCQARAVLSGGERQVVPLSALREGDLLEVIPGEAVPLDGMVVAGGGEVDESMLTGEPMPVGKAPGERVFAGTANLTGSITLRASGGTGDTVLARVIRAVEEAQGREAPVQRAADKVVGWAVPAVCAVAAGTFLYWLSRGVGTSAALMNAVSVLVIACPCALGLATPMAMLRGSSRASSEGILLRGGDVLEALGGVDVVVFDKTGTLSMGRPALTDVAATGMGEEELRLLAASLESRSEHALGRALAGAAEGGLLPVEDFRAHPGGGVEGRVGGRNVVLGSGRFLRERGVTWRPAEEDMRAGLSRAGKTVVGLAQDGGLAGWFALADPPRPEAGEVMRALAARGLDVRVRSGDIPEAVRTMAVEAGLLGEEERAGEADVIRGGASPIEKAQYVRALRESGRRVMMVGDGINDAAALAEAHVGVAVGKATDVARKSADVVFLREDLRLLPSLLKIASHTLGAVRQNLFWAFSYNLVALPLAVTGLIHPIASAALMAGSSLVVAANSLRLGVERRRAPASGERVGERAVSLAS